MPALQFSRNPKVAEHHTANAIEAARVRASIQPQPKGRGTPAVGAAVPRSASGFNSAATQRSRNTVHHCVEQHWINMLQFSRNPKVAEHPVADATRAACAHRFNSAATQRSRNTFAGDRAAALGRLASIQPQPKGRGTRPGPRRASPVPPRASIQPQPKGRGTLWWCVSDQPLDAAGLQFSRNPKVAEHAGRRWSRDTALNRFNSAATQRSRNT